jgi:DNA-binding response OmpR family regulator
VIDLQSHRRIEGNGTSVEELAWRMNILVVDPKKLLGPRAEPVLRARNWRCMVVPSAAKAIAAVMQDAPDAVVIHGDGAAGEAAHLCQRFKQNVLTAGMPLIVAEDATPPAWVLSGLPADAILQSPWGSEELLHHIEALVPVNTGSGTLDDLTNFPRRRSAIDEIARRLLARELFGVGTLRLRETDAYRQDYGRIGFDQFVVLVSVLLRRHANGANPVSISYLDEGTFLVIGQTATVHDIVAQTVRDFDALVPAYYDMDTLFGRDEGHDVGPATWTGLEGAVTLVEPDRFDNVMQIGFVLSNSLASGSDLLHLATATALRDATSGLAAV